MTCRISIHYITYKGFSYSIISFNIFNYTGPVRSLLHGWCVAGEAGVASVWFIMTQYAQFMFGKLYLTTEGGTKGLTNILSQFDYVRMVWPVRPSVLR